MGKGMQSSTIDRLRQRNEQKRRQEEINLALERYNKKIEYQQQIDKAEEESEELGFWDTYGQGIENMLDVYGNLVGFTRRLNTDEDGNYIRQWSMFGLNVWDEDLTEEEFVALNKEYQKDYESKDMFQRKAEEVGTVLWNTIRSVGLTGAELVLDVGNFIYNGTGIYTIGDKQYDFSTKLGQAEAQLDAELRNPDLSESKREELLEIRRALDENISITDKAKSFWNNSIIGQHFKSNDSEALAERVAQRAQAEANLYALYKDRIYTNPVDDFFRRAETQRDKRDAYETSIKNIVRDKEGRPTAILDDKELDPLDDNIITDNIGRNYPVERTTSGNLWDKERIVTNSNGEVVMNSATGEPEYEKVYSTGKKAWNVAKNLFTTDVGSEALLQGAGSMAEFLVPTAGVSGVAAKLGTTSSRLGRAATNLSTAMLQNNMESEQIGQEAFTQTYEERLSEYSGITRENISEELSRDGNNDETVAILLEARYQRKLREWADNNEELASRAWGQALVAGQVAEKTNNQLLPLQMFEVGMITKAMRGLKGGAASTASRNILSNPVTAKGVAGAAGKTLFEGATEYFEENWNDYAVEKGKHLAAGKNYTFADFDMTSAESIQNGMLGFVLGVGMGGVSTTADVRGKNIAYKNQQNFIKTLEKLPEQVRKSTLTDIITGISVEDAIDLSQQMNLAKKEGNPGKLRELSERMLINRTVQSLQTGTADKFVEVLNNMMRGVVENEDGGQQDFENLSKAASFVNQMADFYDTLPAKTQGLGRVLINQGNLIQINDAISEIESMIPSIREHAKEVEENNIRTRYKNTTQASERLIGTEIDIAVEKNPTLVNALQQIENLKDSRAELIGEQKRLTSKEYQQELRNKKAEERVESTIQQTNRSNIEENVQQVEQNQRKPLTTEQKKKIITAIDSEPKKEVGREGVIPSHNAVKIDENGQKNNEKDEELRKLASIAQDSSIPVQDNDSIDMSDPDAIEQINSTLLLSPVLYNSNNQSQKSLVNALKERLQRFDNLRQEKGGDFTSFKDFFEYTIRATSAIEAEGMFNMTKQAYKEFYQEQHPERVIESDKDMESVYNESFTFDSDLKNGTQNAIQESPIRTTEEVKKDNEQEVAESLVDKNIPTPSNLKSSTGEELVVKGKKVASFSFKVPFLSQTYDMLLDKENGTVEFNTNNETILESAKPFLNWNIFTPGKKVKILLPTINGKLTEESLSQPMSVWKGGQEIENATLKDFLENIFKEDIVENLIQEHTLEQLIEKELEQRNLANWEDSYIVQRIPVNLETSGLTNEQGLGKGLHEVTWWNISNIADYTDSILSKNPSLSKDEAKQISMQMQQDLVSQAKEELTALRVELIRNPNQTLNMQVDSRKSGVSLQNTNGTLLPIQDSNPTVEIAIYNNDILTVGGKEFDTKGGLINNIDAIHKLARENDKIGASYMIAQTGITKNEYGEIVPVFTAYEIINNTTSVSEEARSKQQRLFKIGQLIKTAERVFFGASDNTMSRNVAIQILNKITNKDINTLPRKEAGKIIGDAVNTLTGRTVGGVTKFSAYPIEYKDGDTVQYRLNVKEALNKSNQTIITGINVENNGQGQEIVSFEEQNYKDYLKENLYTQIKFQEIENANSDGSSIWINDIQPKIILGRDNSNQVEKENKSPIKKEEKPVNQQTTEESKQSLIEKAQEAAEKAKNYLDETNTSRFTENHIDTIQQNLFGITLNNIPLDKDLSLLDIYTILNQQFNKVTKELREGGSIAEADFMESNRDSILGNGTPNYRNSVREELDLFFNANADEEINLSDGEISKNYNKSSFEQAISMSLSTKVKVFLAGIESDSNQGFTPFGNLKIYQPVDNMISSLQRAFSEASNNSIEGKGGLIEAMQNRMDKSKSKKTGKSPYDFYSQIIEKVKNASPELQKEIQYHLYNSPVNMSFIQFGIDEYGNWTVKVLDADSKNPRFSIGNDFINNLKQSSLIQMKDSKSYSIDKKEAEKIQSIYNRLKELNTNKQLGTEESESLLQEFLFSFGLNVQDGVILSLLNPEFVGSKISLFSAQNNGLLDILINNLNRQIEKQNKGEEVSFGDREKDSTDEGNITIYNNSSNFNSLVEMEELLTFNPQISTYIAHKTINKYEQPKFISEHFKRLVNPVDKSLLIDLSEAHYSKNSMVVQMLKRYTSSGNNLSQKMKLGLASLNVIKKVGDNEESGEISELSLKDYFISVFGFFAHTEEELKKMERVVGNETIPVRLAQMPFPAISDTGSMPLWSTIVYNLTKDLFVMDNREEISFSNTLLEELYGQLVKPDIDRLDAYLKSEVTTNIEGHDLGAGMILGIPGLNSLIIQDKNGNNTTLLSALRQSIFNPSMNGNYNSVAEVVSTNKNSIKKYISDNIKQEMDSILSFDNNGNAKGLLVDNGLWENGRMQGIDRKYLDSRGTNISDKQKAQIAVADFVVNSMVNQSNIQMIFGGDLANYVPEKTRKMFINGDPSKIDPDVLNDIAGVDVAVNDYTHHSKVYEEIGKKVGINLSKRLKEYVSPGNRLANSFGKDSLQVMLNDKEISSSQLLFYTRSLYPKEWRKYQKEVEEFVALDNVRPEDRIDEVLVIDGKTLSKYEYLKDKIQKELPAVAPYMKINNTDAQEYVTWGEHINQLIEQGRLSLEVANQLSKKLEDQTKNGVTEKNKLSEEESRVVMQPTKPLYAGLHFEKYGEGENTYQAQRYIYVKSASFPLLPELTAAFDDLNLLRENIEKLQAQNPNKTVRVSYNSANKVGAIKNAQPVTNLYRTMTDAEIKEFGDRNSITLKKENFSIQQDKPFHTDHDIEEGKREQINMGTQMEDIILGNGINQIQEKIFPSKFDSRLLEDLGIEVSDGNISGEDLSKIYNHLAEQQQKLLSNKLLKKFGLNTFNNLSNRNIQAFEKIAKELNKRLSNRQDQDGITLVYKAVNSNNELVYLTKQELIESKLKPSSVDFKIPIWMLPNSTKFESVLNSIVNNNSINLKISGFSGPVASQAGFRMRKKTLSEYFSEGGNKGVVFTDSWTGELQASRYENNNLRHFQILAPNKFRINKTKEDGTSYQELINIEDYINPETGRVDNSKLPKELLEMFSFRIPTSSHQSGSLVEIVGFLPHNAGDLIIVPGESTIQIGEDYDIDVRNFYMLNTINDADGNIKPISSEVIDTNLEESLTNLQEDYKLYKAGLIQNVRNIQNGIWLNNQEDIAELAILEWILETVYGEKVVNKLSDTLLSNFTNIEENNAVSSESEIIEIQTEIERLKSIILPETIVKEEQKKYQQQLEESLEAIKEGFIEEKNSLYQQISRNSKLLEQYIENQIINTYTSVYSSEDSRVASLINQALNTDFAEGTAEVIDNAYSGESTGFSIFKPLYQQQVMNLGASGKLGIGVHSNWVTFNSIMQQFSTNENPIRIEGLNLRFGNLETDGRLGKLESNAFVEGKKPNEYKPRPVAVVNMENQNSATDNQKLQIMGRRNENRHTINAFALMCNLGLDSDGLKINGTILSYPSLFISQPIIRDYVRLMEYYSSMTTMDVYNIQGTVREELKRIYGKGIAFDSEGNMIQANKDMALESATSQKLYDELTIPTASVQWALFENFEVLNDAGQQIIELQSALNIENGGLGISFFDTIKKKEFLETSILEMESIFPGVSRLIGNFIDIRNEFSKLEEEQKTREEYLQEGYIEISSDSPILIKPETYFGHKIVNAITQGYNLWKNIFPFDEEIINNQISTIIENSNVIPGSKEETELKYKILRNMQDYVYSNMTELFGTSNVNSIREQLMLDTDANQSLATILQQLRTAGHPLMSEPFFKDLSIQLNKSNNPSIITYNKSTVNALQKNSVYKILNRYHKNENIIEINNKPLLVNGKTITYKELIKKLVQYSFLSNQENGAIGFRNQFPLEIFDEYGVTDNLVRNTGVKNTMAHNILYNGTVQAVVNILGDLDTSSNIIKNTNEVSLSEAERYVNLLNRKFEEDFATLLSNGDIQLSKPIMGEGSNFVRQYFQHNVENTKSLPYKTKKEILSRLKVSSMKEVLSFTTNDIFIPTFVQADGSLFERGSDGTYKRVNLLGGFGVNEFRTSGENNISLFEENNFTPEGKVSEKTEPILVSLESTNTERKTAREVVEEVINQKGKFQELAQLLLPYVENNIEIVYTNLPEGINGVFDDRSGKIYISNNITNADLVPVMLEEVLHSITKSSLEKEFTADVVNGKLQFTFSPTASPAARTMAKVYEEGWLTVKKELIKKLGSEDAALNQINSVIERTAEAKQAVKDGKQYSLDLSSEEDTLIYRSTNIHEYLAGLFFNPEFQSILNNTEYLKSKKSIFQKFIDVLSRIVFPDIKDNSILKESISSLVEYLNKIQPIIPVDTEGEFQKKVELLFEIEGEASKLTGVKSRENEGRNLMGDSTLNEILLSPQSSNNQKNKVSLFNEENEINYEELNRQTEEIFQEVTYINSLSLGEEQGRRKGGRRNVQASLLLGEKIRTGSQEQGNTKESQEAILKEFAIKEGIWISPKIIENWVPINDGGMEARIYDDGENVIKVGYNYLNFYDTPLEWLTNKISLHNYLFSNTEIELIGFTETYGATKDVPGTFFASVYRQKYVQGQVLESKESLIEEMEKRGFKRVGESNKYYNKDFIIKDLHEDNVMIDNDGNFHFIDTVPSLNTPESSTPYVNLEGTRKYGNGEVISAKVEENIQTEIPDIISEIDENLC